MRIYGIGKLRRATKWLRKRFKTKGLVLMYHSINEWGSDPWSLSVTPSHFAEHLEVIWKYGRPILLNQLVETLRWGNLSHRTIAVTFDDGYADNLYNAKPLLERYDVPATVFLTTGQIGCESEFWWDELDKIFLQPGTLPETLHLRINGNSYEWKLGDKASYGEDEYRCNSDLRAWDGEISPRHFIYYSLWQLLRPLPEEKQRELLGEVLTWAGAEPVARSTHRSLTFKEMLDLAKGELIEIGSHTVTHPVLPVLSEAAQRDEIQQSKAYLMDALNRNVTSFSYPHGEYTAGTVAIVREAGFRCACTTDNDIFLGHTNYFQLPRVQVEDWDGEEFARRLSGWFGDPSDE